MKKMYAVVDCNNFFVSCERAFNPSLENKPVVVLSNNDGCVVSRSNEAKQAGIPMGAPIFKWKDVVREKKIKVFSSNFVLYGDMSGRVMKTLESLSPVVEYYSIDEAFIPLSLYSEADYYSWAEKVRETILQHTGIPVSIGIAKTRTLAKVANEFAKKWDVCNGVFSFVGMEEEKIFKYLSDLPVENIWGVGYRSARTLHTAKIYTALDLVKTDEQIIRKYLKIMGVRTRMELLGTSCAAFSENRGPRKGIASTRSFGKRITIKEDLAEAIATYVDTACHKLRKQKSVARFLTVHIRTSFHSQTQPYYGRSSTVALPVPSNYTPTFITHAMEELSKIFKPGIQYYKAGVFLSEITSEDAIQQHLFLENHNSQISTQKEVSNAIDSVRTRFGKRLISFGAMGLGNSWTMKSENRTPRYSTELSEILVAH